ncbi:TonB-dependent receptor [Dysgonomonas sp. Marseille-P4361]|uniref:SusC/RagA family TonB-linked outer membrane protein n=1 Tax=Dysgonomonas sp. Marseille-P4361 TaxID=2161820 RepID=UPI000D552E77|nr:TonB-dependent receptor [Dysgonomonas sp. Marseille-P4361]
MIREKHKTVFASLILCFLLLGGANLATAKAERNLGNLHQAPVNKEVTGVVTDPSGEPLIGVSVAVKGSTNRTMTDIDGKFTISCSPSDVLEITYIGFEKYEVQVGASTEINVILNEKTELLDEVIVIGYGTTTRKKAVGAVDQIRSQAIEKRPVANVSQALQGASPSLMIQQRSMDPNSNDINVNIRGISTMNKNEPLLVIDGLVTEFSSLNKLNPSDIENVSVLKDAGTAAIYGSRSANGVILVTTKKGQKNQGPTVRVNTQVGLQDPNVLFEAVDGYQNATLKNLALTNVGSNPQFTPEQIRDLYNHRSEESWHIHQILETAVQQNYNINVSGGSNNTTYMFSGAFFDQESNFVGNYGITRYNLRSNITTEYGRFKFSSILAYTRNNNTSSTAGSAIINSTRIPPYYYYKMQADNGKYLVNDVITDQNPLGELRDGGYTKHDNDYVNVNLNVDFKILDGLTLRGVVGADIYSDHRFIRRKQVPLYANADAIKPLVYVNAERNTEDYNYKAYLLNYQLLLDYNKSFGNHRVYGLIGATNESKTSRNNEIKLKYTDPILGTPTTDTEIDENGSRVSPQGTEERSLTSILGRAGYDFADKYYAEFSFRYDGSSVFPKENRWAFYPSASLGWRMSEESFMEKYRNNIGDLKVRGSYGVLGNQGIAPYQYLTRYSVATNAYGFNNKGVSGAGFTYGNKDLKWESSHVLNIGLDAAFLKNALTVNLDYFYKTTKDILIKPETPTAFGTELSDANAVEMRNQGWEITANYYLKTGAFKHNFMLNVGDSWNKVTKFIGNEQISTSDNISKIIRVGLPLNVYYGFKKEGYFQSVEEIETSALPVGTSASDLKPGDIKYIDRNGDGVIDSKDRYVLGNAFPRYTFAFNYDVEYKGFTFGMFWQGVGKRDMMIRGELVEPFHENYSYVIYKHQLDYWTPTNTNSTWPRLTAAGATSTQNNYQKSSDLYLFDGKYLRLRNIQVGYTLPSTITKKVGMERVHFYVNAENLFTLSKNSFVDPESSEFNSNMSGNANSARNYPMLKYYGLGLEIQF